MVFPYSPPTAQDQAAPASSWNFRVVTAWKLCDPHEQLPTLQALVDTLTDDQKALLASMCYDSLPIRQ